MITDGDNRQMTVKELVDGYVDEYNQNQKGFQRKSGYLYIDREYQRDTVWSDTQRKMFIDSVLRDFPIPEICLRQKINEPGFDIIDGQQRIDTLWWFVKQTRMIREWKSGRGKGGESSKRKNFPPLFDPEKEERLFPKFLQEKKCPWAGKIFDELNSEHPDILEDFYARTVSISQITGSDSEVREMFVRLQGGSALSEQEIRDAMPGKLRDLVLLVGGKNGNFPALYERLRPYWEGFFRGGKDNNYMLTRHPFLYKFGKNPETDSGQVRQLVSQTLLLFLLRQDDDRRRRHIFSTIDADELDACYRRNGEMDAGKGARFLRILDELHFIFDGTKTGKMKNRDIMHLVLLCDMLSDGAFGAQWENHIVSTHNEWRNMCKKADKHRKTGEKIESHLEPAERFNKLAGPHRHNISESHVIYMQHMLESLGGHLRPQISMEDGWWENTDLKEAAYYLEGMRCNRGCAENVPWRNANFHKSPGHAKGRFYESWALAHETCPGKESTAKENPE